MSVFIGAPITNTPANPATTIAGLAGTIGQTIPISAGTRAVAGALIWASSNIGNSGGVAGAANNTRSFACAFGRALQPPGSRPPLGILKIWGNGQLLYDVNVVPKVEYLPLPNGGVNTFSVTSPPLFPNLVPQSPFLGPYFSWTLHDGSSLSSNGIDPTIQADQGPYTPGYHNMIYVVFPNFPVGYFGGTTCPNMTVEFTDGVQLTNNFTAATPLDTTLSTRPGIVADLTSGVIWVPSNTNTASAVLRQFNVRSNTETNRIAITGNIFTDGTYTTNNPYTNMIGFEETGPIYDRDNGLMFGNANAAGNTLPIVCVSLTSGAITDQFGWSNTNVDPTPVGSNFGALGENFGGCVCKTVAGGNPHYAICTQAQLDRWMALVDYSVAGQFLNSRQITSASLAQPANFSGSGVNALNNVMPLPIAAPTAAQSQDFCVLACNYSRVELWYGGFRGSGTTGQASGSSVWLGSQVLYDFGGTNVANFTIVDGADGSIICIGSTSGGGTWSAVKLQVTPQQGAGPNGFQGWWPQVTTTPLWSVSGIPAMGSPFGSFRAAAMFSNTNAGTFGYPTGGGYSSFSILDLGSGVAQTSSTGSLPTGALDFVWDSRLRVAYSNDPSTSRGMDTVVSGQSQGNGALVLSSVLTWIGQKSGYTSGAVSVDASLTDPVFGVLIQEQWPPASLLNNLGAVYGFTWRDSDLQLKFSRTSQAIIGAAPPTPAYTIPIDSMAPAMEDGAQGNESVITIINPPQAAATNADVNYINQATWNYADAVYNDPSFIPNFLGSTNPLPATSVTYKIPVIMSADEAYIRAYNVSIQADMNTVQQEGRLPHQYSRLEPGDVIALTINGYTYNTLLDEVDFNGDWSISYVGYNFNFSQPAAFASGNPNPVVPQLLPGTSDSQAVALDMPMLDPNELPPVGQVVTQVCAASYGQTSWRGATLQYVDALHQTPQTILHTATRAIAGTAYVPLGKCPLPWQTDYTDVLQVVLDGPDGPGILGTTDTGLLQGVNWCVYGAPGRWELISFESVTVVNNALVKLSTLIRGQRGTETSTDSHVAGDRVYFIRGVAQAMAANPQVLPNSDIGTEVDYAALGDSYSQPPAVDRTTFAGYGDYPFAVADVQATLSGSNVVVTWQRRDRAANQAWVTNPVQMSEASELYDADIFSGPLGTLKRTFAGLTTKTFTYTSAQQTSDGFTAPIPNITLQIYQKSAVTGRGFFKQLTLPTS